MHNKEFRQIREPEVGEDLLHSPNTSHLEEWIKAIEFIGFIRCSRKPCRLIGNLIRSISPTTFELKANAEGVAKCIVDVAKSISETYIIIRNQLSNPYHL